MRIIFYAWAVVLYTQLYPSNTGKMLFIAAFNSIVYNF